MCVKNIILILITCAYIYSDYCTHSNKRLHFINLTISTDFVSTNFKKLIFWCRVYQNSILSYTLADITSNDQHSKSFSKETRSSLPPISAFDLIKVNTCNFHIEICFFCFIFNCTILKRNNGANKPWLANKTILFYYKHIFQ